MKEYVIAVLGLNTYGRKIAETVLNSGTEIMVADNDPYVINSVSDKYTYAVSLDLGNADAVSEIGLTDADIVIIDLSDNLEQSIICIMVAKEQGVKRIVATAPNRRFKEILLKMGANEVVIPAEEAAIRMARTVISSGFLEYIDIGGDLCVIKVKPPKAWIGKTVADLRLRTEENILIVAIRDESEECNINFDVNTKLRPDMVLILSIAKDRVMDFI